MGGIPSIGLHRNRLSTHTHTNTHTTLISKPSSKFLSITADYHLLKVFFFLIHCITVTITYLFLKVYSLQKQEYDVLMVRTCSGEKRKIIMQMKSSIF